MCTIGATGLTSSLEFQSFWVQEQVSYVVTETYIYMFLTGPRDARVSKEIFSRPITAGEVMVVVVSTKNPNEVA